MQPAAARQSCKPENIGSFINSLSCIFCAFVQKVHYIQEKANIPLRPRVFPHIPLSVRSFLRRMPGIFLEMFPCRAFVCAVPANVPWNAACPCNPDPVIVPCEIQEAVRGAC